MLFTPLSVPFSTSLSPFAIIFRAAYRAGFGVQPTLSLLTATSSYGKATVCLVCTVRTISYFSYELRRNHKKYLKIITEHEQRFNLIYLTLKTDANRRMPIQLTAQACTASICSTFLLPNNSFFFLFAYALSTFKCPLIVLHSLRSATK